MFFEEFAKQMSQNPAGLYDVELSEYLVFTKVIFFKGNHRTRMTV
jgi:hypothetical protein